MYHDINYRMAYGYANSGGRWPQSSLDLTSVVAINEIAHVRDLFVERNGNRPVPYIVVHESLVKPRYLIVGGGVHATSPATERLHTLLFNDAKIVRLPDTPSLKNSRLYISLPSAIRE